jgi:hypothetical protein
MEFEGHAGTVRYYCQDRLAQRGRHQMADEKTKVVRFTDKMVLTGVGIGLVYWLIETIFSIFMSADIGFIGRLFGPGLSGICTRVIVLCLFVIFGAHAQLTLNKLRKTEAELETVKAQVEALKRENDLLQAR